MLCGALARAVACCFFLVFACFSAASESVRTDDTVPGGRGGGGPGGGPGSVEVAARLYRFGRLCFGGGGPDATEEGGGGGAVAAVDGGGGGGG